MDNSTVTTVTVDPRHISYTNLVYGLHALSILIGILSTTMIATAFIFGLPSIIAVIMSYVRRSEVRGTWLESHFRWQINTFWGALLAFVGVSLVFWPLALIIIGIPFLLLGYFLIGIWAIYRVARGWLALRDGRTLPPGRF